MIDSPMPEPERTIANENVSSHHDTRKKFDRWEGARSCVRLFEALRIAGYF